MSSPGSAAPARAGGVPFLRVVAAISTVAGWCAAAMIVAAVGITCQMNAEAEGLLSRALGGDIVALCPPLIIQEDEVNEMFDRLERALDATEHWVTKEGLRTA